MSASRAARDQSPGADRPYGGKTLDARRAEQRERVLLAARDVFAARGFAGAGVEEIVARAHVSRTTFYAFFENKEECLLGVFDLGLRRIATGVLKVVADTAHADLDPAERVRVEVQAVVGALAADPAMARIVLIEIVGATPAAEQARTRARHTAASIIERQLEEYEDWRKRSRQQRHVASLAAMAAIGEAVSDLVATDRVDNWQEVVDPLSEFVARALGALTDQ